MKRRGAVKKYGEELIYSGAWIVLIGTIVAAIGQTKVTATRSPMGSRLVAQGNAIEAFGNSLQAVGNEKLFLGDREQFHIDAIIGAWLQTGGNITNTVATDIEMNTSEEEGARLNALGSGIQGLGAVYEAVGVVEGNSPTKGLEVTGNSLFALGSFIDATGSVFVSKKLDTTGVQLSFIGSWTQVLGACAEVIAFTIANNIEETSYNTNFYPDPNLMYYWSVPNTNWPVYQLLTPSERYQVFTNTQIV